MSEFLFAEAGIPTDRIEQERQLSSGLPPNPSNSHSTSLSEHWSKSSEERDEQGHITSREAQALAYEVEISIRRGRATPDLVHTARAWGSGQPSPASVVSSVAGLREAATNGPGQEGIALSTVLGIIDEVLAGAMEGVSKSLREAALVDPLTGCSNRRALKEDLERAVAASKRTGLDVAVAVIDVDGLKQINDTHGHAAGDATLKGVADALRSVVRETDDVYRVGGDEFVVVIPFSGSSGATAAMKRALSRGSPVFSFGTASLSMLEADGTIDDLIKLADASLYARRRNERSTASPRHRHRKVLVVGAAVATLGIGVSSYALDWAPVHEVVGAPMPGTGRSMQFHDVPIASPSPEARTQRVKQHQTSHATSNETSNATSVPPSASGSPPAPGRAARTGGPASGSIAPGSGALTVSKVSSPAGKTSDSVVLTAYDTTSKKQQENASDKSSKSSVVPKAAAVPAPTTTIGAPTASWYASADQYQTGCGSPGEKACSNGHTRTMYPGYPDQGSSSPPPAPTGSQGHPSGSWGTAPSGGHPCSGGQSQPNGWATQSSWNSQSNWYHSGGWGSGGWSSGR